MDDTNASNGIELDNEPPDDNDGELGRADRIVDTLETEIREGELREGEKLPSERELVERFKISRMTVRKALQTLVGEGLVASYPGRGYFVVGLRERLQEHHGESILTAPEAPSIAAAELQRSRSFLKYMEQRKRTPGVEFLDPPALVAADAEIAEHLRLDKNELVLRRYRLQLADKLPYRLIESYYPADLFGELIGTDIGDKPLFTWLQERHGLSVVHAKEVLIARLARSSERQLLRLSPGTPVVAFERTVFAHTGRPVEWAHITAVAGLYIFSYEYDIPT